MGDPIEQALQSPKVDARMKTDYTYQREQPGFDPKDWRVTCTAQVGSSDAQLPGVISRIGMIFSIRTPYSNIPEIVKNPKVIRLEPSGAATLTD